MDFKDLAIDLIDEAPLCFKDPGEWAYDEALRRMESGNEMA